MNKLLVNKFSFSHRFFVFSIIVEGLRKQDLERHERFKGWQNSLFPSGNKKSTKKPQVNDIDKPRALNLVTLLFFNRFCTCLGSRSNISMHIAHSVHIFVCKGLRSIDRSTSQAEVFFLVEILYL